MSEYKSPPHKLLRYFEKRRDAWREKYHEKTYENKILKNKIARVGESREQWKGKALELEKRVKELEAELKVHVAELHGLEKKRN